MLPRWRGSYGRTFCAALACLALASGPLALRAEPDATDVPVTAETLDNGLRVVIVENHEAPVVETAIWYRFGANQERPGKTGLAHALAHMMYEGTPGLSAAGLDDVISRLGAKATATTSNDYTAYRFVLPADKLELALRIEADRMQHLLISDAAWQREKAALLAEHDADLAQPLARLYHAVCAAASPQALCALSPLGDKADIQNAGAADVRSYYQDWYGPEDATLVIGGDVQTAGALSLARAVFGAIPKTNLPDRSTQAPAFAYDKQVEVAGDFPYEVVDLAYPAPGSLDPDTAALKIVDAVINNPRSDFYRALVDSGYALGYSTQLDQNADGGLYHVFLITAPGHSNAQARSAFTGVMKDAQETGFSDSLVRAAKIAVALRTTYARDSISGLTERVGYAAAIEGAPSLARDDQRVAALSSAAVTLAIRKYLQTPAVTGLLTPERPQLNAAAEPPPTTVTDDFSGRAPRGRYTEARYVRDLLAAPLNLQTRVRPTSFVLPNGLRVLVAEAHANATVFVEGTLLASERFDPAGKDGTGAMLSTLLDDGTPQTGFDERHRILDELGATMDLGFSFNAHGRARDLDRLIGLIADDVQHPALRAADFETVRKQTLAAVAERDEDPDDRADSEFERMLLTPSDPTLREPTAASISAITLADLRAYARAYLRPDLTLITIVGDVNPRDVEAKVRAAFGAWKKHGPRPSLDPGPMPPSHPGLRIIVTNRPFVQVQVGCPAVAHGSYDYYALNAINEMLGADGAFDTRLVSTLRLRLGIVSWVASDLQTDRYRGIFRFRLRADPKTVGRAVATLREELARLHDDPVGPFELGRARTKIVAGGLVSEESTQVVAARVHTMGLDGLPLDYEATLPARYASLDGAALEAAAQRYLHPESLVEVYEGPLQ
jgi:zinc protease